MSASTMTATAGSIRSDKPDDALGIERALSGQPRQIPPRRALGLRGARAGRASDETSRTYEAWQALGVTRADGQPFPQPEADRQAVGAGRGRAGVPARAEFLCGARPTIRR